MKTDKKGSFLFCYSILIIPYNPSIIAPSFSLTSINHKHHNKVKFTGGALHLAMTFPKSLYQPLEVHFPELRTVLLSISKYSGDVDWFDSHGCAIQFKINTRHIFLAIILYFIRKLLILSRILKHFDTVYSQYSNHFAS